jgi:biopolymer transport protein ExbD
MNRSILIIFSLAVVALVFTACSGNNDEGESKQHDTLAVVDQQPAELIIDARGDSVINLDFAAGDTAKTILAKLERNDQHITVVVPVQDKSKLTASLILLDTLQNIRFNQIIYPSGRSDGPFGKDISITTDENGNYTIIVAHNLMAEGGLVKEFKMQVRIIK